MSDEIQFGVTSHYNQYEGFEVIDVCEQLRAPDGSGGFNRGNAFKYLARAGWKSEEKHVEDLEKAKNYIQREIDRVKAATEIAPAENLAVRQLQDMETRVKQELKTFGDTLVRDADSFRKSAEQALKIADTPVVVKKPAIDRAEPIWNSALKVYCCPWCGRVLRNYKGSDRFICFDTECAYTFRRRDMQVVVDMVDRANLPLIDFRKELDRLEKLEQAQFKANTPATKEDLLESQTKDPRGPILGRAVVEEDATGINVTVHKDKPTWTRSELKRGTNCPMCKTPMHENAYEYSCANGHSLLIIYKDPRPAKDLEEESEKAKNEPRPRCRDRSCNAVLDQGVNFGEYVCPNGHGRLVLTNAERTPWHATSHTADSLQDGDQA